MSTHAPAHGPAHDVLIVGGGLVGASLAIALDAQGLDVGLVEAAPTGALPPVFDQRNLSLAEASLNALQALGVLPLLRAPTGPIRRIHVSRSGDFGRIRLDAALRHIPCLLLTASEGKNAEIESLDAGADAFVIKNEDTSLVIARLGAIIRGHVRIADAAGERVLRAKLLVAADGARSTVRDALGIGADEHDYGQTLFVARLRTQRAPEGTAYERLTDHGPTALLPRGDGHYGLVHGVPRDEVEAVAALDDAAFLARVQDAFGWRAGRFLAVGPRSAYPMQRAIADALVAPRAVLVGNAAQAIHPLGAQGFNLGLRDALTLAECIAGQPADPGAEAVLRTHAARRAEDRRRTVAFSDGLARLTANDAPLLRPLRSAGLVAGDAMGWLQGWLVGGAMGYRGDVPALCRRVAA